MGDRLGDWLAVLEAAYPAADAETWDNVGLQVGDPADAVSAILVCLDITPATLDEAAQRGAEALLAHHPLFFRPLQRLTPDTAPGRLALRAVRLGLSIVAAHTNFDVSEHGTTLPVMALLGITDTRPLAATPTDAGSAKLVVFVPPEATGDVLTAAFSAGAGRIGEYDECSFRVSGTGTFRPSAAASPAVGERERRNDALEERVEIVVPRAAVQAVVAAVTAAHPYEEVAYDVFPTLATGGPQPPAKGAGRVGDLPQPMALADIATRLRDGLPSAHLRVAGDPQRMIRRVAACGGAGDGYVGAALGAGADVYVTGDLRHHVTLDALTQGMALIDAGHYATEAPALPTLVARLEQLGRDRGLTARLLPSAVSTEPWVHVGGDTEDSAR
jgi:dinuclear metal center YbgI/SA1388 family protein